MAPISYTGRVMTRAFVFPGQGSQAVGMGRELAGAFEIARHTFQEVDEALQQNLSRLMFEGPESDLTLTENAQPALMSVSMAVMRVCRGAPRSPGRCSPPRSATRSSCEPRAAPSASRSSTSATSR